MTFTVVVTDRVSKTGLVTLDADDRFSVERFGHSTSPGFIEALTTADALIVRSATRVDRELIDAASSLRVVGRAGVGLDNIDVEAATSRGIAVFNAPDGNTVAAAELTMALMLSLARRVPGADRSIREGNWDRGRFHGVELRGRTLGLIGAGRIGGEVARRAQAFGMTVLAYDPYLAPERAAELGVDLVSLGELISSADVISLHVPLTDETRGLIGAEALGRVKKSAFVVNASRGGVIDESALATALVEGRLAGAALDVFETEPLRSDSLLRQAPNLVLTPHLGASTTEAQVGVARQVAAAIKGALVDGDLSAAVNADRLG
jgi:D-3-phosphoglycerate dehydrogenase